MFLAIRAEFKIATFKVNSTGKLKRENKHWHSFSLPQRFALGRLWTKNLVFSLPAPRKIDVLLSNQCHSFALCTGNFSTKRKKLLRLDLVNVNKQLTSLTRFRWKGWITKRPINIEDIKYNESNLLVDKARNKYKYWFYQLIISV